jgi:F0F1-type ATP synthase membrane subunit c/vacuolar-type H+-ATPase subunit K
MKLLRKFYAQEKKLIKNPETLLAAWVIFGVILGIGMNNFGAGIAIGIAIGAAMYSTRKNSKVKKPHSDQESQTSK